MNLDFFGNPVVAWAWAAGAATAMWLLLWMVRRQVGARLQIWSARTRNRADDLVLAVVCATKGWFLGAVSFHAGAQMLVLPGGAARLLHVLMVAAVVVQIAIWGNLIVGYLIDRHMRLADGEVVRPPAAPAVAAVGFVLRALLWSVLLLMGLDNLGVDITALVAGLGVGGIAVALAVQNILGDLFASLSIVFDKPFEPGDFIVVGETLGTVERVGLKTTRLRSLHGEQIVVSNADLLGSRIRNYKRMEERRIVFGVGVTYDTQRAKLARIPELIRGVISTVPSVRLDRAHFKSFGPSSLDFEIVYFVLDADYNHFMDVQHTINLGIVEAFETAGIEFAFPTQTLHVRAVPAAPESALAHFNL